MKIVARVLALSLAFSSVAWGQESADTKAKAPVGESAEPAAPARSWLNWRNKYGVELTPFGYVRVGYEAVDNDKDVDYVGRNDGFILNNARLGLDGAIGEQLSMRISLEAATDVNKEMNSPFGEVDVRLRDGYGRWDPWYFLGFQAGQFKAPFAAEELRSTADLLFVSRAVGQEGVLVGRGYEQPGVAIDRQLGGMLSPRTPIRLATVDAGGPVSGDLAAAYYFMVSNGNGDNQILNDNSKIAITGRGELHFSDWLRVGGAGIWNERTAGDPPNRVDENDTGFATDLLINPGNLEIFFQFVRIDTDFDTIDTDDQTQQAWHVQAGYRVDTTWFSATPAYRFAQFAPWADTDDEIAGINGDDYELDYHTFGIKLGHPDLPLTFFFDYTVTFEKDPRELNNDRIEVLAQVEF